MWYEMLLPEQRNAADWIVGRIKDGGGAALFSKQGTGKTIITLAVLERIEWSRALIIAPLTAIEVTWSRRLGEFADRDVQVIHPQGLVKHIRRLVKEPWDVVVFDESHIIKARGSLTSRSARKLRHASRRIALSGTPIDESPIDVWAQMRFVDYTVLGDRFTDFAFEFCFKSGYMGREWRFSKRQLPAFLDRVKDSVYRLDDNFLNLPKLTVNLVPVTMLGRQREIYDRFAKDSVIDLESRAVTGQLVTTKNIKLEQITGGFVIADDGTIIEVGRAKLRKLMKLIKSLSAPLVITCRFIAEVKAITELLRHMRVESLSGEVPPLDRARIIDDFSKGYIDVLVCQIRTGGVSIELTRANHLIMYSCGYSQIDFSQFVSRLQRYGQTKPVTIHVLYAEDSIDEHIHQTIADKLHAVNLVVNQLNVDT